MGPFIHLTCNCGKTRSDDPETGYPDYANRLVPLFTMSSARFYLGLAIVLLLSLGSQFFFGWYLPELKPYIGLGYVAMGYFTTLSVLIYYLSKRLGTHENPYLLLYLTYAVILFKLASSVIIVYAFKRSYHPDTRYFVLPFIVVYILFTIFETAYMAKSGQLKSNAIPRS